MSMLLQRPQQSKGKKKKKAQAQQEEESAAAPSLQQQQEEEEAEGAPGAAVDVAADPSAAAASVAAAQPQADLVAPLEQQQQQQQVGEQQLDGEPPIAAAPAAPAVEVQQPIEPAAAAASSVSAAPPVVAEAEAKAEDPVEAPLPPIGEASYVPYPSLLSAQSLGGARQISADPGGEMDAEMEHSPVYPQSINNEPGQVEGQMLSVPPSPLVEEGVPGAEQQQLQQLPAAAMAPPPAFLPAFQPQQLPAVAAQVPPPSFAPQQHQPLQPQYAQPLYAQPQYVQQPPQQYAQPQYAQPQYVPPQPLHQQHPQVQWALPQQQFAPAPPMMHQQQIPVQQQHFAPVPMMQHTPAPVLQQQVQAPAPFHVLQVQAAAQAAAQVQLSVPSMLHSQMEARTRALNRPASIPSVLGALESDAASAALLAAQLAECKGYSHWFERRAGSLRSKFFDLVDQYRTSHFNVCGVVQAALDASLRCEIALQNLWRLRQVRVDQRHVCGDGVTLEQSITHAVAEFAVPADAEAAYAQLAALQKLAIQELAAHRFLAQSARLQVELFLTELLATQGLAVGPAPLGSLQPSLAQRGEGEGSGGAPGGLSIHEGRSAYAAASSAAASSSSAAAATPAAAASTGSSSSGASTADFITQVRSCVDVLFFFEKQRDEATERARALWIQRARVRRDQRAALAAQRAANVAILEQQPPDAAQMHAQHVASPSASSPSPPAAALAAEAAAALSESDLDGGDADDLDAAAIAAGKPPREESQFRLDVRRWLRIGVESLYARGGYADHRYVMSQVLRCRGVTRWASFVQLQRANEHDRAAARDARNRMHHAPMEGQGDDAPFAAAAAASASGVADDGWEWSDAFVQHFLSSLTLILNPFEGKQLKLVSAASPSASSAYVADRAEEAVAADWQREAAAEEGESVRLAEHGDHAMSPAHAPAHSGSSAGAAEWIVLDQSKLRHMHNADISYRIALNETDYLDILAHTPVLPFVRARFFPLFLALARRHVALHAAQQDAANPAGAAASSGRSGGSAAAADYDSAYESYDRHSLSVAFAQVKLVLSLLSGALSGRFPAEYTQLSKFVAKLQCQIIGLVGAAWARAWGLAHMEQRHAAVGGLAAAAALGLGPDGLDEDPASMGAGGVGGDGSSGSGEGAAHTGLWPYPCCFACHGFHALLQKELDFATLRLVCTLQHCPSVGVKFFLSEVPTHLLSVEAAGQAFLALMQQSRSGDYADSSISFTPLTLQPWLSYLSTPAGVATRANFVTLLLNPSGSGDYVHVLMALTKLATKQPFEISPAVLAPVGSQPHTHQHQQQRAARAGSSAHPMETDGSAAAAGSDEPSLSPDSSDDEKSSVSSGGGRRRANKSSYRFKSAPTDLPLILLHELFHIAYLNLATREDLHRPCAGFLVSLCAVHPLAVSFLLFLCHANFRYIAGGAAALFESIDLRHWRPTASDAYILQSLLLTPAHTASNELARSVLLRLNFDWAVMEEPDQAQHAPHGRHSFSAREGARDGGNAGASRRQSVAQQESGAHVFFPPRSRVPVLGWAFHRALLLMLADVRLASLRSPVLASSLASSSGGGGAGAAGSGPSAPPPCPFTSFVNFPTCAWAHMLAPGHSRRNSGAAAHAASAAATAQNNLPQPPPVEQHLQQQFEQHLRQQQFLHQQSYPHTHPLSPVSGAGSPPFSAPAFSSASPSLPPLSSMGAHNGGVGAGFSSSVTALLAPASAALADMFGAGTSKRAIEPSWWLAMLSLLHARSVMDAASASAGDAPSCFVPPPSKSWLSARWGVKGVDLEEYTSLVRRDPVLSYIQLTSSWLGADAALFAREGWPLMKSILADSTFAGLGWRLLHDLIPGLVRAPSAQAHVAAGASAAAQGQGSPSWAMVGHPAAQPPSLALGPSGGSFSGAGMLVPGPPSRGPSSRRGSHAHAHALAPVPSPSRELVQSLGIVRHLLESARPKGMFAFIQSKTVTYESTERLAQVVVAHVVQAMRSPAEPALRAGHASAASSSAAAPSMLQSLFGYWSQEVARSPQKSSEQWQRDHNARYLFDQLCRAVLLFTDWFSAANERSRGAAVHSAPGMRLLMQFTGEQAVAAAVAAAGGNNASSLIGAERRGGSYLDSHEAHAAQNPYAAAAASVAAPAAGGVDDDDRELSFPFEPNMTPPKAVIESLTPPESILSSFGLSNKEVLQRHPYAAFLALQEETLADRAAWLKLGHMISRWGGSNALKPSLKRVGITDERVRRGCLLRRWFSFALALPPEHPLLPLFWQMVFRLLFARMVLSRPLPGNQGGFYGFRFLQGTSGRAIVGQAREHLGALVALSSKRRLDAIQSNHAGVAIHPSVYELPALFAAMQCWITGEGSGSGSGSSANADPSEHINSLRERLLGFGVTLQEKYCPARLASILLPPAARAVPLWWDLVDVPRLRWEILGECHASLSLRGPSSVGGAGAGWEPFPSPRSFLAVAAGAAASPSSAGELLAHRFFWKYYLTQSYELGRFAPAPRSIAAILRRKKAHEIGSTSSPSAGSSPSAASSSSSSGSGGNPFADHVLTELEAQSLFSAAEYASALVAKPAPAPDAALQRSLVASAAAAAAGGAKRRKGSFGYWSSSAMSPSPMPVLGPGGGMGMVMGGGGVASALQIPSVLLASLWDLLASDSTALQPLQHATRLFSDRYSQATALDRQLADFLPLLFRNELAQYTVVRPCREAWGVSGSKCRAPAQFQFNYSRAVKLQQISDSIAANRSQAAVCTSTDQNASAAIGEEVSRGLCATLVALQRLLHQIALVGARPVQGEAPRLHSAEGGDMVVLRPTGSGQPQEEEERWVRHVVSAGLRWLWRLAELDSVITSLFPPAHHFVHASVATLAPLLAHPYEQGVALQERLLELLSRHTALLANLSSFVRPDVAAEPQEFVNLFRMALTVRDETGVTSVRVLRRFDVPRWLALQPPPPLSARQQLFAMCVAQLREEEKHPRRRSPAGSAVSLASESLCNVYAEMLGAMVRANLGDTFSPFLRSLLEDTSSFGALGSPYMPAAMPVSSASASSPSVSAAAAAGGMGSFASTRAPAWLHSLWRTLSEQPLHTLEFAQLSKACEQIEGCMWDVRRAHSQRLQELLAKKQPPVSLLLHSNVRLHSLLGDLLPTIMLLFGAFFAATHPSAHPPATHGSATSTVVCYASDDSKKRAAWQCVWQCFSAFCAPDPPPLPGSPAASIAPTSHPYLEAQQALVLDTLVCAMSTLQSGSDSRDNWVMQAFWHTYREQITVNADASFLALLHRSIIAHTRVHSTAPPGGVIAATSCRPIPSPPQLDFHESWVLTSADLASFTNTLQQVVELHERETAVLMAAEKARRDQEHEVAARLARGNARREAKLQQPAAVTRADVRLMSLHGGKVAIVATFLSHLLAASNWACALQQKPRQPSAESAFGSPMHDSPRHADAQVMGPGLFEPAVITNPYELYDPSPSGEYATTFVATVAQILMELPHVSFGAPGSAVAAAAAAAASSGSTLLLPHFQLLLDTLLRVDWSGVLLVRLPVEAFQMRYGRREMARREQMAAQGMLASDSDEFASPDDADADVDDHPQSALPAPEEAHNMGLSALDREVESMQTLLEQVSLVLYAERNVARVVQESVSLAQANAAAAAAASAASPANKSGGMLASLLSNPFAAIVSSAGSARHHNAPAAAASSSFAENESGPVSPPLRGAGAPVPPLTDADVYGLVRPHFHRASNSLVVRYVRDVDASGAPLLAGCEVASPMARVHYLFRLLSRLCAPLPPAPFLVFQRSVSARHYFPPLVVMLRKSRLYCEWLLSVFHGDAAPRPLMHERQYLDIAAGLLSELDAHHDCVQRVVGDEAFLPVIQEFLFCANLEARGVPVSAAVRALTDRIFGSTYERLSLLAFTASCRSIISVEKLALFLEAVLQSQMLDGGIFGQQQQGHGHGHGQALVSQWQTVSATLQVPELSFDEFLFACLNNGAILTLHVVALQQLMLSAGMLSNPNSRGSGSGGAPSRAGAGYNDVLPSTPASSSLLDPLSKHTLAQPRSSHSAGAVIQPAAAAASSSSASVSPPLPSAPLFDAKMIQQRIDQLAQWLQKAHVRDAPSSSSAGGRGSLSSAGGSGKDGSAAPAAIPIKPSSRHAAVADEDAEPIKLIVVLRTLLEWQGALARAYLAARNQPAYSCVQAARWSNPLLATLSVFPDAFPLLSSADVLLDQLQLLLLRWIGATRQGGGLMGAIGLATAPRYSVRFRLLLRALHTYLLLHVQAASAPVAAALVAGNAKLAKGRPLHFVYDAQAGGTLPPAARADLLQSFLQLAAVKPFAAHSSTVRVAAAILAQAADPALYTPANPPASTFVPLLYAPVLLDQLVACIFPELAN